MTTGIAPHAAGRGEDLQRSLDQMRRRPCWPPIAVLVLAASVGACDDDPVGPRNRNPVILSLTAFPNTIGLTDSAIVICHAMEPDADSLFYDWFTDARLTIKGALPGDNFLYNTRENSRIFYHGSVTPVNDTAFVQCIVRDRRGGADGRIVRIVLLR